MTIAAARKLFRRLPLPLQNLARRLAPGRAAAAERERWIRETYFTFGQNERRRLFLSIARFAHINRPIRGLYMEFGSHEANTMRMAHDTFSHLFDWTYVAFDSFEGLPEIAAIDRQEIWEKGKLRTDEAEFRRICLRHGIPAERLVTVKGFYEDSLNEATRQRLAGAKAAVVYVDCDLYASTVEVLRFIKDFLQRGTILVFDDWNCFHGDPARGERLAFAEFRAAHPELHFEPFVSTGEAQSFIFVGERLQAGSA